MQALVDDAWRNDCRKIYESYAIYYQSDGAEQKVFDSGSGTFASRSDQLLAKLTHVVDLPEGGRLVDIGCGNGNFLRSFSRRFPKWRLVGSEYDERHRAIVEAISGVEAFCSEGATGLPGEFDAVSLIHVLEHIESPRAVLETIRTKLKPGGYLIIELPLFTNNAFELLIADHATHFQSATIESLLRQAGFAPLAVTTDWIPKELSVVARAAPVREPACALSKHTLDDALRWLGAVRRDAQDLARRSERFGIFGTSIAATWLWSEVKDNTSFFVDEDILRAGGRHFELPIYPPDEVPDGSDVYVALPPKLSRAVVKRLQHEQARYHKVPAKA